MREKVEKQKKKKPQKGAQWKAGGRGRDRVVVLSSEAFDSSMIFVLPNHLHNLH